MSEASARCFLCGGRALAATDRSLLYPSGRTRRFALACGFCGILTDRVEGEAALAHLADAVTGSSFESDPDAPCGLDLYTLRTAATRWRRRADPADEDGRKGLRAPHSPLAASARLSDLGASEGVPVALGVMCRPEERNAVLAAAAPHHAWAAGIVVLVGGEGPDETLPGGTRIAHRRLAGDFGAQRNALQDLSPAPWMLQLDADETLDAASGALLPVLAALGEAGDTVSIGLPRRNLVDGILADLYPDTQYRLNRREVRYRNRVHERPVRPWQRSFIALHGTIDHHLSHARVENRSAAYEAMAPGRGRLEEAEDLLRPYRDR